MSLSALDRLVLDLLDRYLTLGTLRVNLPDGSRRELGSGTDFSAAVTLHRPRGLIGLAFRPDPALGLAYMDGVFDMAEGELEDLIHLLRHNLRPGPFYLPVRVWRALQAFGFRLRQFNNPAGSRRNVAHHYDLGNELYSRFLDPEMLYSCAFWEGEDDLNAAQQRKMRITTDRLALHEPGLSVLDIGCGWGALTRHIAARGAGRVTGITLSQEQLAGAVARKNALEPATAARLSYQLQDYRHHAADHQAAYDRVVSVGMFEHVGIPQHKVFFRHVRRLLKPGGIAVIHSIIRPIAAMTDRWLDRHIFPGGYIPTAAEMQQSAAKVGLVVDAVHIHPGIHYARTLGAWRDRFRTRQDELPDRYDTRFRRMWEFYLAGSKDCFSADHGGMQVVQLVVRNVAHVPLV